MVHIKRLDEMLWYDQLFDNMPSASDDQRGHNIGIQKCYEILNTKTAQSILKRHGVGMNRTKESIVLYIPTKGKYANDFDNENMAMQECLNELDRETELYFGTDCVSNFGILADKLAYTSVGIIKIERALEEECRYDFLRYYGMASVLKGLLNKGYDHLVEYEFDRYRFQRKDYAKSSEIVLDDIKGEILEYAKQYIKKAYPSYSIELRTGKRGYDTGRGEYESFIIYHGSSSNPNNQTGGFELTQNKFGDTHCYVHYGLGGSTDYDFDINNWKKSIEELIGSFCKK